MAAQCASVIARIDETLAAVRRIATSLRPSVLDELGLAAAVEWQGQEFGNRTGITVVTELSMGGTVVSDELGSSIFRILQEALTNVARHAHASRVSIGLIRVADLLTLVVADDGVGLSSDPFPGTATLCIVGMRERALACGGVLRITGAPGSGTSVTLRVPLRAEPGG
jgi:signal transduction histidine kinase